MKKIFNVKLLIIVLIVISLFKLNNCFALSYYTIDKYDINATVLENGDIHVEEDIIYSFKENYNMIGKNILLTEFLGEDEKKYMPIKIENLNVYIVDDLNGETAIPCFNDNLYNNYENYYTVKYLNNSIDLDIYSNSIIGTKKHIKYIYDLKNAAVKYNNTGVVYWNFISNNLRTNVNKVNIKIKFEKYPKNLSIYPHSYCDISTVKYYDKYAEFEIYNLGLQSSVEARVIFDNDSISNSKNVVNSEYDIQKMKDAEDKIKLDKIRYNISIYIYIFFDVYMVISYIIIIIFILKKSNKGKSKNIKYSKSILNKLNMEEYNILDGKSCLKPELFISTLTNLISKNILKLEILTDEDIRKNGKEVCEYYLSVKSNADLSNLTNYQILVINYLFNKSVNSIKIETLVERSIFLKERLKYLSKDYRLVKAFAVECSKIDLNIKEKLYERADIKKENLFISISIILLLIFMIVNTFVISPIRILNNITPVIISFSFLIGYIILLLPFTDIYVIKEKYITEYNRLQSLKKYIVNYSVIKNKNNITFEDEKNIFNYLSFAAIFGVIQTFSKDLSECIKNVMDENKDLFKTYPILHACINFSFLSPMISTATGRNSGGVYTKKENDNKC